MRLGVCGVLWVLLRRRMLVLLVVLGGVRSVHFIIEILKFLVAHGYWGLAGFILKLESFVYLV